MSMWATFSNAVHHIVHRFRERLKTWSEIAPRRHQKQNLDATIILSSYQQNIYPDTFETHLTMYMLE